MSMHEDYYDDLPRLDPAIQHTLDGWRNAMLYAPNTAKRLKAITEFSKLLARYGDRAIEARDWITEVSLDMYELDADQVQGALAKGANAAFDEQMRKGGAKKPAPEIDLAAAFTFLGNAPHTAPRELIRGLLPADGVVMTGGQSSAGKTFIQIHKAICLATGTPYFGHKIVERVGTVFVAAEGRAMIPNRFAAALAKADITKPLPIAWPNRMPNFGSADGIRLFICELKAADEKFRGDFGVRLGMVAVDTVAACFAMRDEDDNAEATKVCNVMRSIGQELGAVMAPVHHFGKNAESGLRGASAWRGSADAVEGVLADIDPLTGKVSNRELVCAKSRDGEQGPIAPFNLEFITLGTNADGEVYGSCCVIPAEGQSRFDKAATPTKSQRAIQDAIAEALDTHGMDVMPRAGMPPVKAAKVSDVRKEFDRRYVVDETDTAKAAHAKRMAFQRALDRLPPSRFGAGSVSGVDCIWKAT